MEVKVARMKVRVESVKFTSAKVNVISVKVKVILVKEILIKVILVRGAHSHLLPLSLHTRPPLCGRTPVDPVCNQFDHHHKHEHDLDHHRAPVDDPGDHALVDVVEVKVEGGSTAHHLWLARRVCK